MRDKDASTAWTAASDGALDERLYYCQNWRADVVALLNAEKGVVEWVKYSAYGVPFAMPKGDANSDGACNSIDDGIVNGWTSSGYDVRGDLDLDGDVDAADYAAVQIAHQSLGRSVLTSVGNRKGYAGYEFDSYRGRQYHVRNRVLDAVLGRWTRRDVRGYVDGASVYASFRCSPTQYLDWSGNSTEMLGDPYGLFYGPSEPDSPSSSCDAPGAGSTAVLATGTDCCALAEQWLVAHGRRAGTVGLTFCCGKTIKHCDFDPYPGETDAGKKYGYGLVRGCAQSHEKKHKPCCDCSKGTTGQFSECDSSGKSSAEKQACCANADKATRDCLAGKGGLAGESADKKCEKKFGKDATNVQSCKDAAHEYDESHGKAGEKCK